MGNNLNKTSKIQTETFHTNLLKNVIVIGDTGVGKSWLLNRLFCLENDSLIFEESSTIQSQTSSISMPFQKRVELEEESQKKSFDLCATDTHGINNIQEKTSYFITKLQQELKSKPYTVVLVFKYDKFTRYTKQTLNIIKACFKQTLRDDSTIVVINKRPQDLKSFINFDQECEKLFDKISLKLKINLTHRFVLLKDDSDLNSKINQLLVLIKNSSPILH